MEVENYKMGHYTVLNFSLLQTFTTILNFIHTTNKNCANKHFYVHEKL